MCLKSRSGRGDSPDLGEGKGSGRALHRSRHLGRVLKDDYGGSGERDSPVQRPGGMKQTHWQVKYRLTCFGGREDVGEGPEGPRPWMQSSEWGWLFQDTGELWKILGWGGTKPDLGLQKSHRCRLSGPSLGTLGWVSRYHLQVLLLAPSSSPSQRGETTCQA